jgi:hypothetical protein
MWYIYITYLHVEVMKVFSKYFALAYIHFLSLKILNEMWRQLDVGNILSISILK